MSICGDCKKNPCACDVYEFGSGDTIGESVGSIGPVLMQKGMLLRVTVNPDGGVRISLDQNICHDIDMKDIIFIVGSLRQLEHTLLTIYDERRSK